MKIKTKLFIFISGLVILSVSTLTWISSSALMKEIILDKSHEVEKVAENRHQMLIAQLTNYQQNTKNLIERLVVLCALEKNSQFFNMCVLERLHLQLKLENANGAIFRQSKNKIEFIVGKVENLSIKKSDFEKDSIAVFRNRGKDNFAHPFYIMATDNKFGIEVFVEYPLYSIQNIFLPQNDLGAGGETFLSDKDGFFITKQRHPSLHNHSQDGTREPISVAPMIACLQKKSTYMLDVDYRKEPIIHGFKYVPEIGGGCIMAHMEQREAFASAQTMINKMIGFALAIFALTIPLILFFANHITRPLAYLAGIAETVSKGDEEMQSQLQRKDEIGVLSNKFNQMLLSIKESRKELELHQQTIFESSKLNAMGEMARGVAHEINSPLAAIILGAELIEHKNTKTAVPNSDITKLAKSILEAGTRIDKIVKGLRGVARDAKDDEQQTFSIKHLVNSARIFCGEMLKANNVELIIREEYLDTRIFGKETLLSQCLLNLISNSFEAVKGLDEKWIQLSVEIVDNMVEIKIMDSGHGISKEIQKKMFRPMFTTKPTGSGPGLGLSVSRTILTNFGGNIVYDDKCEHTCFIVKLPYT